MATLTGTFTDTMAYPLDAYGGDDLAALFLNLFYQTDKNYFQSSGDVPDVSMQYDYQAVAPPTATLGPQGDTTPHNITVQLSAVALQVYKLKDGQRGAKLFDATLPFTAYGVLGVEGGILSFSSLKLVVDGSSFGDKLVQRLVDDHVLPSMQKLIENVKLPQLQNVFDSGISGGVEGVVITQAPDGRFVVQIGAVITGGGNPGSADPAPPAILSQLSTSQPTGHSAAVFALVSQDALNTFIERMLGPQSKPFDKRSSSHGFGGGARGTLHTTTPHVTITNGRASASLTVSTRLQVGIEGFGIWTWSHISVPDVDATVDFELLSPDGVHAYLHLTGVESFNINLGDWPPGFKKVEHLIERLLDEIVEAFHSEINRLVKAVVIKLFALPSNIPGTKIPAHLGFAPNGLRFYGSSVGALIGIAAG